jgi:NitT/TauT family transport system permease protein
MKASDAFHNARKIGIWTLRIPIYGLAYYLAHAALNRPAFPGVGRILNAIVRDVLPGFAVHLPATIIRWFLVYVLGLALGLLGGVLIGYFRRLHEAVKFEVDFFRSLPATVLVVFILAAFGDGHIQRSLPAFYITFFTVLFYVAKHMAMLKRTRIEHLVDLGASRAFILRHCVYYELLPVIMVASRQAISLSFLVAISVELIVGSYGNVGLGKLLYDWKFYTNYSDIIGGLIVIGGIGYALNLAMLKLHRKMVPWHNIET